MFWPLPPYNLLPRSCLTWIFFVDPHWWVPLCVQCPAKAIPFQQIIIHALQCQHGIDVHLLFCFDLDLHIPSFRVYGGHMIYMYTYFVLTSINSCFIHMQQHAPPWIAGAGHPCSDRSLLCNVFNKKTSWIQVHICECRFIGGITLLVIFFRWKHSMTLKLWVKISQQNQVNIL